MPDFERKRLFHTPPTWVPDDSAFFITVCCDPPRKNQLCHSRIAEQIHESVVHRQRSHIWFVSLFLLMPDHLHTILRYDRRRQPLDILIKNWKRYLARFAKIQWQDGFFDHRIRTLQEYREKDSYIRQNPVRANLCKRPEDWPYVWDLENLDR